jgi:hypothetical protein
MYNANFGILGSHFELLCDLELEKFISLYLRFQTDMNSNIIYVYIVIGSTLATFFYNFVSLMAASLDLAIFSMFPISDFGKLFFLLKIEVSKV